MTAPPRRARALRFLLRSVAALALAITFVVSVAGALLLHVNLPAGRRVAAAALTDLLRDVFTGTLTVGAIDHVGLRGVQARDVTVRDGAGRTVLSVSRLRASTDVPALVRELLWGGEKTTLVVNHARVERAEAWIVPNPNTGVPTLVDALTPREVPRAPDEPESARYVRVWLPVVEVGQGFARGHVGALPVLEAEVSSVRGSVLASPKGAAIDIVKFSTVVRGILGADARGIANLHIREPGAVWSSFDGYLGELQFGSVVRYDQERLDVTLDVPRARPESARALWPDWPLYADASLHVEASGTLPKLDVKGRVEVERSRVTANGMVDLSGALGADLDVEARSLDLRAVLPDAPETALDLFTNVSIASSATGPVVDVRGTTEPTEIAGIAIPAADIAGTYDSDGFEGRATVHERGLPMRATIKIQRNGTVDLDVESERFQIAAAPRLEPYLPARGLSRATVKARIEERRLDAKFSVDVQGFELGDVQLASARVSGSSKGSLDHPERLQIDATLQGKGLRAGQFAFETVSASARGPASSPTVSATLTDPHGPNLVAKAQVRPGNETRLEKVELEIRREQAALRGRVERIDLGEGVVVVRRLALSGDGGELAGSLELRPGLLSLEARGENLDLDATARLLGLPRGQIGGRARVDAELVLARDVRRGRVRIGLGNATIGPVSGASLNVRAALDGDDFGGDASGQIAGLGAFGAAWDTRLQGPVDQLESYERATGSVELNFQELDLDYVSQLVPAGTGVESFSGTLAGSLRLTRDEPNALPTLSAIAQTRGLTIEREKPLGGGQAPPAVSGLDLVLSAHVDGESGESDATLQLKQGLSTLASLSASAEVDLQRVRKNPDEIGTVLAETPLLAKLVVEERAIDGLPEPLRPPIARGTVRLEVSLRGTYLEPTFDAKVDLGGIHLGEAEGAPIDVCTQLEYEKASGRFGGRGEVFLPTALRAGRKVCSERRVAQLSAGGTARWEDLTRADDQGAPRWTGSAGAMLEGLPLETIEPLAAAGLAGQAYGALMFERRQAVPQLSANIELRRATVDRMPIGDGRIVIRTGGTTLRGEVDFERDGGSLKAQILTALDWDGVVPSLDDAQPLSVSVQARKVDASILEPLLTDFVTDLGGDLDANFAAQLTPLPRKGDGPRYTGYVNGTVALQSGTVQLAGTALRLNDVEFVAVASTEGDTTLVTVPQLKGKALSKADNLRAHVELRFKNLELVSGSATMNVVDVPLVTQGVTRANATGGLAATLRRTAGEMLLDVEVSRLEAKLPRSSTRALIELDDNPSIQVLQPLGEPRAKRGKDALPWRVRLNLGRNAKITRADLLLPVSGRLELLMADDYSISGDVELGAGGRLQLLLGKTFIIESGEVHFDTGDPEDPRINVVSSWHAPNDTTVYAKVSGRFKKSTLVLQSDPPLAEDEIYALLLGAGTGQESEGATASGIGAGALGALLADTPFNRVQLRTATGQTADQRDYATYTAGYQVSDKLVVEGSYKDVASATTPNDRDMAVSGAVDWRFHRNWSLRTEIGTIGTGLDLLWQYRY